MKLKRMRFVEAVMLLFCIVGISFAVNAKTIGIWQDHRSYVTAGFTNSLVEAGWDIEWLESKRGKNDLENPEKLAKIDVLFFGGGWSAYYFPSPKARLELIRFVASGKGILLSGFRSGYVRTANRPMFPEIGAVYNRISSAWIGPEGDSPMAAAFGGQARIFSGVDHLCVKPGPLGKPFCSSGDDIVGTYGEFYNGRVVVFGAHFMYQIVDETKEHTEKILFAILKYLSTQRQVMPVDTALRKAEADFIRREMLYTYTLDDRGPDRKPGIYPAIRDKALSEVQALAYKLEYFISVLEKGGATKAEVSKYKAHAAKLQKTCKVVRGIYEKNIEEVKAKIANATPAEISLTPALKAEFFDIDRYARAIYGRVRANDLETARIFIDELRPKVKAVKRAMLEKEIAEDLKKVPEILAKLSSKCDDERYEATLELGRISPDDKAVVEALVKAIDDTNERVRTQAVISLGWMQAKDAIDALISKISTKDLFLKRRIIQALGLIGDEKAIPVLLNELNGGEILSRLCAATALGHLKASEATDKLLEIVDNTTEDDELRLSSVLALGDIGDKKAGERIASIREELSKKRSARRQGIENYLSSRRRLEMWTVTKIALDRIAAGGRPTRGVKQPEEYRSKDAFYAITKRFNAFVGRTETTKGSFEMMGQKLLWPHVKNAGFTGVHNAWGWRDRYTAEEFVEIVREADEMGLIWIDVMNGFARGFYPSFEVVISRFEEEGISGFRGLWSEETWPKVEGTKKEFLAFAQERYGKDWVKRLALTDAEKNLLAEMKDDAPIFFGMPGPNKPLEAGFASPWDGTLRTLFLEFEAKMLENVWRESQDYLHARRKGFAQTYVISTADPTKVIGGITAVEKLDSLGHESYESFGRSTAYFMERYRNGGAARSVMSEQYNWYCPSNDHALRGFWQNAIHSKCYYNFALHQIFEQPSWYDVWSWERGRWDAAKEVFNRVAKTPELYAIKPSAANAAVIFSERCSSAVKEQIYFQCSIPTRTDHDAMAAWTALGQSQIPADVLWAESLDAKRLSKYKFVYLPTSKYLAAKEIQALREWVKEGGTLVAEGTTSLFDGLSLKRLDNYALADVFGCNWVETKFLTGDNSDTYATRHGSKVSAYKVVPGLDKPLNIDDSIHRDKKPVKSVMTMKMAADAGDVLTGGAEVEFDGALGYDIVKAVTAKPLAFYNGTDKAALLVNEYGKGRAYFIAANYFAHGHVTSRWEMMPGVYAFWKNVREMIFGAYKASGIKPVVEVGGVSLEVAVSVDDHGDKYVVHLLDYDVKSKLVKGATLTLPGERKIKRVYYPGAKPLKLEGRTVKLRDFSVYDMFVVEFEN